MNTAIAKKWVEALRSRRYQQGQNYLCDRGRYCCLGVLCDLYVQETGMDAQWMHQRGQPSISGTSTILPSVLVREWIDFSYDQAMSYTHLNDGLNKSFDEIANIIEQQIARIENECRCETEVDSSPAVR